MKGNGTRILRMAMGIAFVPILGACGGDNEPEINPPVAAPAQTLRVTSLDLGKSVGTDRKVIVGTDEFGARDTIYASVATEGSASTGTLVARWTYEDGQLVEESSQNIAPANAAVTEFHISKPDDFPAGDYKVEIALNGQAVESEDFTVR
jgi:hypothetical protein